MFGKRTPEDGTIEFEAQIGNGKKVVARETIRKLDSDELKKQYTAATYQVSDLEQRPGCFGGILNLFRGKNKARK